MDNILPLICTMFFVTPSTNLNPKAVNYWETGTEIKGASIKLDESGVTLHGAMVDKTWKDFTISIRDTYITIQFDGPIGPEDNYNEIQLNRLTASGFVFFSRTKVAEPAPNPTYSVRCQVSLKP